jgi:hypothetical protein
MRMVFGSDANLDSMADFFESTLAGIKMRFEISPPLLLERTWHQIAELTPE